MNFYTWLTNGWYYIRFYHHVYFTNYFSKSHTNSLEKPNYKLVFSEEFNEPINWDWWGWCEEWGCIRDMVIYKQSQVTQSGSDAVLTSDINNIENEPKVKTGGLYSQGFMYGYFEARMKVPPKGLKYWPAFWLCGKGGWPPEIDVFELMGSDSSYFTMTLHWRNTQTDQVRKIYDQIYQVYGYKATNFDLTIDFLRQEPWTQEKQKFIDALIGATTVKMKGRRLKFLGKDFLSKDFHIFACKWSKDKVIWYIDNLAVYVLDNHIPNKIMSCILNNNYTYGGTNPIPSELPMNLYIDNFRVYEKC